MKLQSLVVIFAIIIIPISLVLSAYIQSHIDTIAIQTSYDTKLSNATYDAIKAFQLNTINSKYSSVSDSKIRDIEASINTFFMTLGSNFSMDVYGQTNLKKFVPAIVYTLYDGYYIYSPYTNAYNNRYMYGLKPYIYYSCRYISGNVDVVINYTLDNCIVVYGTINNTYVTKSGYLINIATTENNPGVNIKDDKVFYNGVRIEKEELSENLITIDSDPNASTDTVDNKIINKNNYTYVYEDNEKLYFEPAENSSDNGRNFIISNNTKKYKTTDIKEDTSAIEYYKEAKKFTEWVQENLGEITPSCAVDVKTGAKITEFAGDTSKIFEISTNNDPEKDEADFNNHRREIIRRSIQDNLTSAIANYNENSEARNSTYDFKMPILLEQEWDKIINNVCVITFLQGLPIGNKYYNNYCIITNNINREFVSKSTIEIIASGDGYHHSIGCSQLLNDENKEKNVIGYLNTSFIRQTVTYNEKSYYFYPHENLGCYHCMVDSTKVVDLNTVLSDNKYKALQKVFWTALARERQNLYKVNQYFNEVIEEAYPPIPTGFKHLEGTIEKGFVIKNESDGNEFVWIPVGYDINGTKLSYERENFENMSDYSDYEELDETEVKYIERNRGFYIARYETGKNDGKLVIQKGEVLDLYAMNKIRDDYGDEAVNTKIKEIKDKCTSLYNNNSEIYTKLCSSYAWDTTLNFIGIDHSEYLTNSNPGWYMNLNGNNENITKTGEAGYVNNIYDLGGNAWELTTESYNGNPSIVIRGGDSDHNSNDAPATIRKNLQEIKTNRVSYRVMLIVK